MTELSVMPDHHQILDLCCVVYNPDTYLFLVHCVKRVLGKGLSVGYRKINGAYHSDDAITSDVINKTEMSICVTVHNAQRSRV